MWCAFICVYDLLTGRPAKICDHFWMKKTKFIRHTHQIIKIYCFLYSSLMISVYTSYLTPYLGARTHTVSVCPFDFPPLLLSKKQTTTNKWSNGQFIFFIIANYCDFYTYKTNNKNYKLRLFNWLHHITIYEKNMMLCRTKCSHHFSLSCCFVSLHLEIQERTKKTPTKCSSANNNNDKIKIEYSVIIAHHLFMCTLTISNLNRCRHRRRSMCSIKFCNCTCTFSNWHQILILALYGFSHCFVCRFALKMGNGVIFSQLIRFRFPHDVYVCVTLSI